MRRGDHTCIARPRAGPQLTFNPTVPPATILSGPGGGDLEKWEAGLSQGPRSQNTDIAHTHTLAAPVTALITPP